MEQNSYKPHISSTQISLPFSQLHSRRFEDLCLRIITRKYSFKALEHPGRSGNDGGVDIEGYINLKGQDVSVAIQCKCYKKISGSQLVEALKEFKINYPKFSGQFWIMTSADVSKKARDKFKEVASEMQVEVFIIDNSILEDHVRSLPDVLGEFFYAPVSFLKQRQHESAALIIKRAQRFKDEFLQEYDKSFSGEFPLIRERQKVMGEILNIAILELKSELGVLTNCTDIVTNIQQSGTKLISNYRAAGQTTDGLPFFGGNVACNAISNESTIRASFQENCEKLLALMRSYWLCCTNQPLVDLCKKCLEVFAS